MTNQQTSTTNPAVPPPFEWEEVRRDGICKRCTVKRDAFEIELTVETDPYFPFLTPGQLELEDENKEAYDVIARVCFHGVCLATVANMFTIEVDGPYGQSLYEEWLELVNETAHETLEEAIPVAREKLAELKAA